MLYKLLLVALGGSIGSVLRYLTAIAAGRMLGLNFPWGTVAVNVVGSLVMGLFIGFLALRAHGGEALRLFFAVGVLGGFTTLSSYSLDTVVLFQRGAIVEAALYAVGSVVVSILALAGGLAIVRTFG